MAETKTPNFGWTKPDIGGDSSTWGNVLNTTFDAIDSVAYANQQSGVPIGSIVMYAGSSPPAGWLWCLGQVYADTDIPNLVPILNHAFPGSDGSHTALPNLGGRAPVGYDGGGWAMGAMAGEVNHTLLYYEVPSHNHSAYQDAHNHYNWQDAHVHAAWQNAHTHSVYQDAHVHADAGHGHGVSASASQDAHTHSLSRRGRGRLRSWVWQQLWECRRRQPAARQPTPSMFPSRLARVTPISMRVSRQSILILKHQQSRSTPVSLGFIPTIANRLSTRAQRATTTLTTTCSRTPSLVSS